MYSENDLLEVKNQLRKVLIEIGIVFILAAAVSIASAIYISNRLGMAILIVGVSIDIFIWGMFGNPVRLYRGFLTELLTGQSHIRQVRVKEVNPDPVYKDNKLFYYEILVEDEGIERLYLIDANKPLPEIEQDRTYDFKVYENFIIDIRE